MNIKRNVLHILSTVLVLLTCIGIVKVNIDTVYAQEEIVSGWNSDEMELSCTNTVGDNSGAGLNKVSGIASWSSDGTSITGEVRTAYKSWFGNYYNQSETTLKLKNKLSSAITITIDWNNKSVSTAQFAESDLKYSTLGNAGETGVITKAVEPNECVYIHLQSSSNSKDTETFVINSIKVEKESQSTIYLAATELGGYTLVNTSTNESFDVSSVEKESYTIIHKNTSGEETVKTYNATESMPYSFSSTDNLEFTQKENSGNAFYRWVGKINGNTEALSSNEKFSIVNLQDGITIVPEFLSKSELEKISKGLTVGEDSYYFWEEAVSKAVETGRQIVVTKDYTFPTSLEENHLNSDGTYVKKDESGLQYILPQGITTIVSYDDTKTTLNSATADMPYALCEIRSDNGSLSSPTTGVNHTLTVPKTVTFEIQDGGILAIGGYIYGNVGISGYTISKAGYLHSNISLEGNINVNSGGIFTTCGYVLGKGEISVNAGGKLYEPFVVEDYWGGGYTVGASGITVARKGWKPVSKDESKWGIAPFTMWHLPNIQAKINVQESGKLLGYADLYASNNQYSTTSVIIGSDGNGILQLKKNASAVIEHNSGNKVSTRNGKTITTANYFGETTINLYGGADLDGMQLTVNLITDITVDTKNYTFPVPYNFKINLGGSGDYTVAHKLALYPGAELRVEDGSTLNIESGGSISIYGDIYDTRAQSSSATVTTKISSYGSVNGWLYYPTYSDLKNSAYSENAKMVVNGKLHVHSQGKLGGLITSESENAEIETDKDSVLWTSVQYGGFGEYSFLTKKYCAAGASVHDLTAQVYNPTQAKLDEAEGKKTNIGIVTLEPGMTYRAQPEYDGTMNSYSYTAYTDSSSSGTNTVVTIGKKSDGSDGDLFPTYSVPVEGAFYTNKVSYQTSDGQTFDPHLLVGSTDSFMMEPDGDTRYIITGYTAVRDSDGSVFKQEDNVQLEQLELEGIDSDITVTVTAKAYKHKVGWSVTTVDGVESATDYINDNTASYTLPAGVLVKTTTVKTEAGDEVTVQVNTDYSGASGVITISGIKEDINVDVQTEGYKYKVTYNVDQDGDGTIDRTLYALVPTSTESNHVYSVKYIAPNDPGARYIVKTVTCDDSNVEITNDKESVILSNLTKDIVVNITLQKYDYQVSFTVTGNKSDKLAIAKKYVVAGEKVKVNNSDVKANYVFKNAQLTEGTANVVSTPTLLTVRDITSDTTVVANMYYYKWIVTVKNTIGKLLQTSYVEEDATVDYKYTDNTYIYDSNVSGDANVTVAEDSKSVSISNIKSDTTVTLTTMSYDYIVTYVNKSNGSTLKIDYVSEGYASTYTAPNNNSERKYIVSAESDDDGKITNKQTSVSVTPSADMTVRLTLQDYKYAVTWKGKISTKGKEETVTETHYITGNTDQYSVDADHNITESSITTDNTNVTAVLFNLHRIDLSGITKDVTVSFAAADYDYAVTWVVNGETTKTEYITGNTASWSEVPDKHVITEAKIDSAVNGTINHTNKSVKVTLTGDATVSIKTEEALDTYTYVMGDMSYQYAKNSAIYTYDNDKNDWDKQYGKTFAWQHRAGVKTKTIVDAEGNKKQYTVANGSILLLNKSNQIVDYTITLTPTVDWAGMTFTVNGSVGDYKEVPNEANKIVVTVQPGKEITVISQITGQTDADKLSPDQGQIVGNISVTMNPGD